MLNVWVGACRDALPFMLFIFFVPASGLAIANY